MAIDTLPPDTAEAFELKASTFMLPVLRLRSADWDVVQRQLAEKVRQAPAFFSRTPVVVDLNEFPAADDGLEIGPLLDLLRQHGLLPVGLRSGSDLARAAAPALGLPVLSVGERSRSSRPERPRAPAPTPKAERPGRAQTRVVAQPVRSGQQVYARDGDLIVLKAVGAGAEVIADGNIHILGPLRGKALAGAGGDRDVRIICQCLEAELVAIAGQYRLFEGGVDSALRGLPTQIYLRDEKLCIEPL